MFFLIQNSNTNTQMVRNLRFYSSVNNCYTIPEDDLELGQSRLLEVDNRVVVPAKTHLRIIVTPADVPHSWAVPSSGVKCDAVPGRLVQREGVYYGQCSEICGTNHAFLRAPGNRDQLVLFFILCMLLLYAKSQIVFCDGLNAFSPPPSPVQLPQEPVTPTEAQPVPQPVPVVIPELVQPLLSDENRRGILYNRYLLLNFGVGDSADLRPMTTIIFAQFIVERNIEAALVDDGFSPNSIISRYREIRGLIHSPQGRLLTERTYNDYIAQRRARGTRESVPYRRVIRAVRNFHLFLDR